MDVSHLASPPLVAFRLACSSVIVCFVLDSGPVSAAPPSFADQVQPILARFCSSCHGANKQEGDVRIDKLDPDLVGGNDAERWHQALNLINRGDMPPADAPQPDAATLEQIACRIRASVEQESQRTGTPVTISVGGYFCQPGEDLDVLLRNADQALYEAKRNGRNRVCIRTGTGEAIHPA